MPSNMNDQYNGWLIDSSQTASRSVLREPDVNIIEDPVNEWKVRLRSCVNKKVVLSISEICDLLPESFQDPAEIEVGFLNYQKVLWVNGKGGLYHSETGMVLDGTYLTRFPRERQHPHLAEAWVEQMRPVSAYPSIDQCLYLPFAHCGNFGHFMTETMAFLWILFQEDNFKYSGVPVLLSGCSSDQSLCSALASILASKACIPLLDEHLPHALCLNSVVVPQPSLSLQAKASSLHYAMTEKVADLLIGENEVDELIPPLNLEKIYVSRSELKGEVRRVEGEKVLEAELESLGWFIFHPQSYPLEAQIAIYRQARCIAGFEGSALHALSFLGIVDQNVSVIMMGDNPSIDYFLQFRAQGFSGFFIACTEVDQGDQRLPHIQRRLLRIEPKSIAFQVNILSNL